jgi:uncharacterized membrane protein YgcG
MKQIAFSRCLLATVILLPTAVALGAAAEVVDKAGYFSPDAVAQANDELKKIRQQYGRDFRVETYLTVPSDVQAAYAADQKDELYAKWAYQRAKAAGVHGVMVLITKDPGRLQISVGEETRRQAFTVADRDHLRDRLLECFKSKEYDRALREGVGLFRAALGNNGVGNSLPAPSPNFPFATTSVTTTEAATTAPADGLAAKNAVVIEYEGDHRRERPPLKLEREAVQEAEQLRRSHYLEVGDSWFCVVCARHTVAGTWLSVPPLTQQFKGITYAIFTTPINEADTLNGVEWRGRVVVRAKALRSRDAGLKDDTGWSQWTSKWNISEEVWHAELHKANGQWKIDRHGDTETPGILAASMYSYDILALPEKDERTLKLELQKLAENNPRNPQLLFNYATFLVTCKDEGLRDAKAAVDFATTCNELTGNRVASVLQILAEALFQANRVTEAIEKQRAAIASLPAGASFRELRARYDNNVKKFSENAKGEKTAQ